MPMRTFFLRNGLDPKAYGPEDARAKLEHSLAKFGTDEDAGE